MFPDDIKISQALSSAEAKGLTIAAADPARAGCSPRRLPPSRIVAVVDRAFVTYSSKAKMEMPRVAELDIEHSAVSERVARTWPLAWFIRIVPPRHYESPGPAAANKPVGLVYIAVVRADSRMGSSTKTSSRGTVTISACERLDAPCGCWHMR